MAFKFLPRKRQSVRDRTTQEWGSLAESLRRGESLPSKTLRNDAVKLYRDLGAILRLSDPFAVQAQKKLESAVFHPGTDWRWRPDVFCGLVAPTGLAAPIGGQKLGEEISIWHDCANKALMVRQIPNSYANIPAPFGMRLETLSFSGEYLSLSMELPKSVQDWLGKSHILRLDVNIQSESWVEIYGRLNMAQGPNVEQVLRKIDDPVSDNPYYKTIEFDLAYADLSERPIENVWLDVIFSSPYMNAIDLRDMVLSRYPRAEV